MRRQYRIAFCCWVCARACAGAGAGAGVCPGCCWVLKAAPLPAPPSKEARSAVVGSVVEAAAGSLGEGVDAGSWLASIWRMACRIGSGWVVVLALRSALELTLTLEELMGRRCCCADDGEGVPRYELDMFVDVGTDTSGSIVFDGISLRSPSASLDIDIFFSAESKSFHKPKSQRPVILSS